MLSASLDLCEVLLRPLYSRLCGGAFVVELGSLLGILVIVEHAVLPAALDALDPCIHAREVALGLRQGVAGDDQVGGHPSGNALPSLVEVHVVVEQVAKEGLVDELPPDRPLVARLRAQVEAGRASVGLSVRRAWDREHRRAAAAALEQPAGEQMPSLWRSAALPSVARGAERPHTVEHAWIDDGLVYAGKDLALVGDPAGVGCVREHSPYRRRPVQQFA
jgi:hypothetical protein